MRLKTLGGLRLQTSDFSRPKPLLLLAYLAIEGSQHRRVVADLFFSDAKNPRDALSTSFRRLKKLDDTLVIADGDKIASLVTCDVNELLSALNNNNAEAALELYQGSFLTGFDLALSEELEEWVFLTREYLASRVRQAQLGLSESLLIQGQLTAAANLAENALDLDGAPELEPDDYIHAYEILVSAKSPRAAKLKTEAKAFGISLKLGRNLKTAIGNTQITKGVPHNLAPPISSFVGRDPELLELANLLVQPHVRLITLHGPGGVGKSRLASQVAFEQIRDGVFDGVFFISLEALKAGEQIVIAITSALGLELDETEPLEQLKSYLKPTKMLLILDNYEHLIAWASLVLDLLEVCPRLKLIVTSRERLNLAEEHLLTLTGLSLPEKSGKLETSRFNDAVQLFLQRAQKTLLSFSVAENDLVLVTRLIHLLEGFPLAIELAASWVRALSLVDIIQEIETNLDFLTSSILNSSDRHKSTRATFEYSWQLLGKKEQEALMKLAVFKGDFSKEAASKVVGLNLTSVVKLVDKSLIKPTANGRFTRHALVFQYSYEKLIKQPAIYLEVQEQHANYFLTFAEAAKPQLRGSQPQLWLERIEHDYENLRAAFDYLLGSNQLQKASILPSALGQYWLTRGYFDEGKRWFTQLLSHPENQGYSELRASLLSSAGGLAYNQGNYATARFNLEESLSILRELGDKAIARPLNNLGLIAKALGDYAAAQSYLEESLAINRDLGDKRSIATTLNNLGNLANVQGNYLAARPLLLECLAIEREFGDTRAVASTLNNLGKVSEMQKDYAAALALHHESLSLKEVIGDKPGMANSYNNLGILAKTQEDYGLAHSFFEKSLMLMREIKNKQGIADTLFNLGTLAEVQHNHLLADACFTENLELSWSFGDSIGVADCLEHLVVLYANSHAHLQMAACLWGASTALREKVENASDSGSAKLRASAQKMNKTLGEKLFNDLSNKGKHLPLDEVVALVLAGSQGNASLRQRL